VGRNRSDSYGWITIALHWLVAVGVLSLFPLGLWMTSLTYYDPWYKDAPFIHKSMGVLLFIALCARLAWRLVSPVPAPLPSVSELERRVAGSVHKLLYALLFAVMLSGYLISTADGRPIEVFNWFELPATVHGLPNQEDYAGYAHLTLAIVLIVLVAAHALAALKHHFLDKDRTLLRMLGRPASGNQSGHESPTFPDQKGVLR